MGPSHIIIVCPGHIIWSRSHYYYFWTGRDLKFRQHSPLLRLSCNCVSCILLSRYFLFRPWSHYYYFCSGALRDGTVFIFQDGKRRDGMGFKTCQLSSAFNTISTVFISISLLFISISAISKSSVAIAAALPLVQFER